MSKSLRLGQQQQPWQQRRRTILTHQRRRPVSPLVLGNFLLLLLFLIQLQQSPCYVQAQQQVEQLHLLPPMQRNYGQWYAMNYKNRYPAITYAQMKPSGATAGGGSNIMTKHPPWMRPPIQIGPPRPPLMMNPPARPPAPTAYKPQPKRNNIYGMNRNNNNNNNNNYRMAWRPMNIPKVAKGGGGGATMWRMPSTKYHNPYWMNMVGGRRMMTWDMTGKGKGFTRAPTPNTTGGGIDRDPAPTPTGTPPAAAPAYFQPPTPSPDGTPRPVAATPTYFQPPAYFQPPTRPTNNDNIPPRDAFDPAPVVFVPRTLPPTRPPVLPPSSRQPPPSPSPPPIPSAVRRPTNAPISTAPSPSAGSDGDRGYQIYFTRKPTQSPTSTPTNEPTNKPTNKPTNRKPTSRPIPTSAPTDNMMIVTRPPIHPPTRTPTTLPTRPPTRSPTHSPTRRPTSAATIVSMPTDGTWVQVGQELDGENTGDSFGYAVDISSDGSRMIVGAIFANSPNGDKTGRAQVFEWNTNANQWAQIGQNLDGSNPDDFYGGFVKIAANGSVVAIGGPGEDTSNGINSGTARVFELNDASDSWVQKGQDLVGDAEGDEFGVVVSLSDDGNIVAVGGFVNDSNGEDSGHVIVYKFNESSNTWNPLGSELVGEAPEDNFGVCLDLSADGTRLAVGAWQSDSGGNDNAGRVQIFSLVNGDWVQLGQSLDGEFPDDAFGISVALSKDGTTVIAGGYANDGVNGEDSGHAEVWRYNDDSGLWVQLGQDIDGEAPEDASGWTVDISADGSIVAVGAFGNDANGENSGHVRVYQYDVSGTKTWLQLGEDLDGEVANEFFGTWTALSDDGTIVAAGGDGDVTGHARVYSYKTP